PDCRLHMSDVKYAENADQADGNSREDQHETSAGPLRNAEAGDGDPKAQYSDHEPRQFHLSPLNRINAPRVPTAWLSGTARQPLPSPPGTAESAGRCLL